LIKSFVVRVYGRDPADATRLTGTVEDVEYGRKTAFQNIRELWTMLDDFCRTEGDKGEGTEDVVAHLGRRSGSRRHGSRRNR